MYCRWSAIGPDMLGATGSIYTEHPQKVRSSQCVTKQVDRKSSMDRTGRVGLPGVTDDYPPTIGKKTHVPHPEWNIFTQRTWPHFQQAPSPKSNCWSWSTTQILPKSTRPLTGLTLHKSYWYADHSAFPRIVFTRLQCRTETQ